MFISSQIESLESRLQLSAVVVLGTLIVRGTNGNDDVHVVHNVNTNQYDVTVNGHDDGSFNFDQVNHVVIRTYNGADFIRVEEAVPEINGEVGKPTFIYSGAGNDAINTGNERDLIYAADGNDIISAGGGINLIDAGAGNDRITGGTSVDAAYGGDGDDTIVGGDGNDLLLGSNGADAIDAGAGNDRVFGGNHNDTIQGGTGNDTLWGQAGYDRIAGGGGDDVLGGVEGINTLIGNSGHDLFYVFSSLSGQSNDFDSTIDILKTLPHE